MANQQCRTTNMRSMPACASNNTPSPSTSNMQWPALLAGLSASMSERGLFVHIVLEEGRVVRYLLAAPLAVAIAIHGDVLGMACSRRSCHLWKPWML